MRTATKFVEPLTDERRQRLKEILPFSAYQSFKNLSEALDEILRGVGSKYRLNFAR
jgi:hypothetical protein